MSESDDRKKAVFDTGVVLQAALSDVGSAFACLRLMEAGKIIVPLSPQVREEYEEVLTRPAILAKTQFLRLRGWDCCLAFWMQKPAP